MSIKVSAWVWKHSKQRGTKKLLLLALADFANDSGICWPSTKTLSEYIGETDRHTRQLIQELEKSGDVLREAGGGRGNPSRYAIAVGLNDKQRAKLQEVLKNSVLKNPVSGNTVVQNSVPENTDMGSSAETLRSGDENPALQRTETLRSGDPVEPTFGASERVETGHAVGGIRHDPSCDPSKESPVRKPRTGSVSDSAHQHLMSVYADLLGYKIPNGKKEGEAAKKILAAGYTVEQVETCYQDLKSRDFYANQHLSLQTVYSQIGAIVVAKKTKARKQTKYAIRESKSPEQIAADHAALAQALRGESSPTREAPKGIA